MAPVPKTGGVDRAPVSWHNREKGENMDPLALFEARKSIRSFDRALPAREDLETMVNAARLAPTGKNKQNWHIVYTENRDLMEKAARLISEKNERLREGMTDENKKEALKRMAPFTLFFREAPSLVFFFHGEYSVTGHEALRQAGLEEEAADLLEASPGIQGAAAAMENFLLCAAFLGYGTCWMTAPLYAARELESLVGLKRDGFRLMAITPLGKMVSHADSPRPVRKPLVEMLTVIP